MKKRLLTLGLSVVLASALLTGCGGGNDSSDSGSSDGTTYKVGIIQYVDDASLNQIEQNVEEQLDKPEKGIVLDLGDFTMNLSDIDPRRYLKANVAIEITNPEPLAEEPKKESGGHGGHGEAAAPDPKAAIVAEMEQYKPAIRDAVITVLTSKTSDELATTAGKELAKQQIAEAVNGIFDGEREVIRVSFGQFIMQ